MKLSLACGCCRPSKSKVHRETNDPPIEATPEEVQAIRDQLAEIEQSLSRLWGPTIWSRTPECIRIRGEAADLIDKHFDGIVEQWGESIAYIIHGHSKYDQDGRQGNMVNSLIRFIDHLRDPRQYLHLRLSAPALPGRNARAGQAVPVQRHPYRAQANHSQSRQLDARAAGGWSGCANRWSPRSTSGA